MTSSEADAAAGVVKKMTKAQRRKLQKESDKNRWPQHPHIKSSEARAKAYLRVAGLGKNKKNTPDLDPQLDLQSPEVKFGRLLGGTDARVRHAAVLKLTAYLKARSDIEAHGFSELDFLKLWKGLWHTLYMADKVPVQDELSHQIARLLWCFAGTPEEDEHAAHAYMTLYSEDQEEYLMQQMAEGSEDSDGSSKDDDDCQGGSEDSGDEEEDGVTMEEVSNTLGDEGGEEPSSDDDSDNNLDDENEDDMEEEAVDDSEVQHCRGAHLVSLFVRTFFRTVRREWGHMDKYRVDKFYTLCRYVLSEIMEYMAIRHWNLGILRLFNDALYEEVLSQTPNGLRFHLIDITLEELAKVNAKAPMPLTEATFLDCLEPYFAMTQSAPDAIVQARVVENVLEKFLDEYSVVSECAQAGHVGTNERSGLIMDQVHVGTVAEFIFDVASDGDTRDLYRKGLYQLHKKYSRRLKQVGRDVELEHAHDRGENELEEEDAAVTEARHQMEDDKAAELQPAAPDAVKTSTKKKKKCKGTKARKADSSVKPTEESPEEPVAENTQPLQKKKRKKKKKKDKQLKTPKEQEITISVDEQASAKSALKKKTESEQRNQEAPSRSSKRKHAHAAGTDSQREDEKRVKFGNKNRARSWKASMKNLRTMNAPATDVTPEKGILLNKKAKAKIAQKRRKAVDYF